MIQNKTRRFGITLRIALLAWLITLVTVSIFVTVIIPEQKQTFLENLESKANSVAVSIRDVAAGAVVNEDYGTLVEHCLQILKGDKSIDYLVITKNNGESWIHDNSGWRFSQLPRAWHPERRTPSSAIGVVSEFQRRVFHYSQPFDYSGIQWGWVHVGLSLKTYDRSVAKVYRRTGILALICVLLSLLASGLYARFLVKPILTLQTVVLRVARGDLSARAVIRTGDEVELLADSFNAMAGSLLQRDKILGSVRFASQQFLAVTDWRTVAIEVLARIGQAAEISRAYMFENHAGPDGRLLTSECFEYAAPGEASLIHTPHLQNRPWYGTGLEAWAECLKQGRVFSGIVRELSPAVQALLAPQRIQSFILAPIQVEGAWWGDLGFDDCACERTWTDAEVDSLRALADMLGAAIARQRVQDALLEAKQTLEQRVSERTRELQDQVAATLRSEADKEMILATALMGIIILERDTHRIRYINTTAQKLVGRTQESLIGECCHAVICPVQQGKCPVTDLHQTVDRSERLLVDGQGNCVPILKSVVPITYEGSPCLLESFIDLTEQKRSEQAVENLHRELLVASREAGMAEVATGVLHNVGNVLNSVNVSTTLIREKLRRSEISTLGKVRDLLQQHQADLGAFLITDPKGKQVPNFIIQLTECLEKEQAALQDEHEQLARNVEHIKEIVAMQQNYARVSGILEQVSVANLLDDALQMNTAGLARHGIEIIRQYSEVPPLTLDKHKVLQILINLVNNARFALDESRDGDKRLTVGISMNGDDLVKVTAVDNGVGIPPENLTRIFSHGFTTRKRGHGFGLHSGANAAKEMGGQLTVSSEGLGKGATFTLELPMTNRRSQS
jgi:sensor histidine kinase regulating citrate/malate metabolism